MNDKLTESAKHLSAAAGSKGGNARAQKLSPEQRKAIAAAAAEARWGRKVLAATHTGEIRIGDQTIVCAVLEDGTRVINQSILLTAMGRDRRARHGQAGPPVLSAANLQAYVSPKLKDALYNPITYTPPTGGRALGFPADVLPELCEIYLAARADKRLVPTQRRAAAAAEILVRGLARLGIVALIDEATGYQEVRARYELQQILEAYVQAELRPWLKVFPDEFYKEMYRINGWEFRPGTSKRTPATGRLVNKYIYEALPDGVLDELRRRNPVTEAGYRRHRHHQFLTDNTGVPHLDRQIAIVLMLMRIARSKREFEELFERAYPPAQERLPLVVDPNDPDF